MIPGLMVGHSTTLCAQALSESRTTDEMTFVLSPFAWALSAGARIDIDNRRITLNNGGADSIGSGDVAFASTLEIRPDRAAAIFGIIYSSVADSHAVQSGPAASAVVGQALSRSLVLDPMISYRVADRERATVDLMVGVRITFFKSTFEGGGPDGSAAVSTDWGAAIVGARLAVRFTSKTFATVNADAGGAWPDALGSARTWHVEGMGGWRFSSRGSIVVGYKRLFNYRRDNSLEANIEGRGILAGVRVLVTKTRLSSSQLAGFPSRPIRP